MKKNRLKKHMLNFFQVLFFCLLPLSVSAAPTTTYKLEWDWTPLPLEVKMALASPSDASRVSETGIANDNMNLSFRSLIVNGEVKLASKERAIIYLVIKNNGTKMLKFSVAPHSTHPGTSALGFNFNCLCNGHIYKVGPGEVWYRILEIKQNESIGSSTIILKHKIFEVKNN